MIPSIKAWPPMEVFFAQLLFLHLAIYILPFLNDTIITFYHIILPLIY